MMRPRRLITLSTPGGLPGIGRGGVWRMISCTSVIGTPNSSSPSVKTTSWRVWSSAMTSVLMAT